jgi:hypothetical protein
MELEVLCGLSGGPSLHGIKDAMNNSQHFDNSVRSPLLAR